MNWLLEHQFQTHLKDLFIYLMLLLQWSQDEQKHLVPKSFKEKEEKREKEKEGKEKERVNIEVPQLIPILPMLSVWGVLDGIAAGNAVVELVGLSVGDVVGVLVGIVKSNIVCALLGIAVGEVEDHLVGMADGDVLWVHL